MATAGIYDDLLKIHSIGSAAVIANGNSDNVIPLNVLFSGKFAGTSGDQIAIKINVAAIKKSAANETYTIAVQTDSVAGFTDAPVLHQTLTIDRDVDPDLHELLVDLETLLKTDANAAFLRLVITVGGTGPSITFSAFANPIVGGGRP